MRKFEDKIKDSRMPEADVFGIKRLACSVCEQDCPGYTCSSRLFAANSQAANEFPTFCKVCRCPAHFHTVQENQVHVPEEFQKLITGNPLLSQDINFNCMLSVFSAQTQSQTAEIVAAFEKEGIEVLSVSQKQPSVEEALYLRNRITQRQEEAMKQVVGKNFQKQGKANEIRATGQIDSLSLNALGQKDPYLLERLSMIRESEKPRMNSNSIDE